MQRFACNLISRIDSNSLLQRRDSLTILSFSPENNTKIVVRLGRVFAGVPCEFAGSAMMFLGFYETSLPGQARIYKDMGFRQGLHSDRLPIPPFRSLFVTFFSVQMSPLDGNAPTMVPWN